MSFTNVGLVWNNHHHVLHATKRVSGAVLWANLFLLFWLSLVPFVIRWMDEAHFSSLPTAGYGVILAMVSVGYILLERTIVACDGPNSPLASAVGRDWKSLLSLVIYAIGVALAFVHPWLAISSYVAIALMWFVPDPRIERRDDAQFDGMQLVGKQKIALHLRGDRVLRWEALELRSARRSDPGTGGTRDDAQASSTLEPAPNPCRERAP